MTASESKKTIEEIFHPRSIAVIGARSNESLENDGWVSWLVDFGYQGSIYPVNPRAGEIMGLKAYASLKDPNIDIILTHLVIDIYGGTGDRLSQSMDETVGILIRLSHKLIKPLVLVLYAGERIETMLAVLLARKRCLEAGVPVYPSVPAAARAMSRLINYYEFLSRTGDQKNT